MRVVLLSPPPPHFPFCIYLSKWGLIFKSSLFHLFSLKRDCLVVKCPLQLWWEALRLKECIHLVSVECHGCKIVQECPLFMKLLPERYFLYGDVWIIVMLVCGLVWHVTAGSVGRSESLGCWVLAARVWPSSLWGKNRLEWMWASFGPPFSRKQCVRFGLISCL